jgi:hypothetical protein
MEVGKKEGEKLGRWEGGKVGLEVGSWNAESGKKEDEKVGMEVGSRNAEGGKKEGSKIFGSRKSECGNGKPGKAGR